MITLPDSIKIIEKDSKKIIFEVKPLYPGYGVTLGNALRRILLSSIKGAAITQVKIKGASHEFSVISGVKEDVLNIILNLKRIKLKLSGEESQKIELKVSGEKEVKAGDVKVPPQVEIINKDQHIASLTSSRAKIEAEMQVRNGFGYIDTEELKEEERSPVGIIYIDAVFSPVKKVVFWVENIRFEKRTDYNKLRMEVETDGSVDPQKAVKEACRILVQHFEKVGGTFIVKEPSAPRPEKKEGKKTEITLEDLKLSIRSLNALKKNRIKTLNQLLGKKENNLNKMKGLGEKGIKEIKRKLKKKRLELRQ